MLTFDLIFLLFFLLFLFKLLPGGGRLLPNQSESTLIDERHVFIILPSFISSHAYPSFHMKRKKTHRKKKENF